MSSEPPVEATPPADAERWRDPKLSPAERAAALIPLMSLEEKAAQLVGVWVGANATGGAVVAPHQDQLKDVPWSAVIKHGLGQLTRPYGTAPVAPSAGARSVAASQAEIVAASRFGIPAMVHEECLTGFSTWRATAFPTPLSWGASFDPGLVEEMAAAIGASMRAAGVHQGLAPLLDVTRDYRWGRCEETIGEDPYLVGLIGAAYVRGLESAGIVSTLKHFAGYSASRGGRNLAPVSMGPREFADVILTPFEMAIRLGRPRSVMNSYSDVDGVPVAADARLLTGLLREEWGFTGTVVADYTSIRFLDTLHGVAADGAECAALALRAGIDVELPSVDTYGAPLVDAVRAGAIDEALVDRALLRVLTQKAELGLLDADWQPLPDGVDSLDFDPPAHRDIALRMAREAIILLRNRNQVLPLAKSAKVALVGPVADDPLCLLGCYSFPLHVGVHHPDYGIGVEILSLREALAKVVPDLGYAPGCTVRGDDTSGIAAAAALAAQADVCVLAVGDKAGMFGRGTSGEGCDAIDLRLPGAQAELVAAVLATGTPVVLVLLAGRPYALGPEVDAAAAIVASFFPGQLGAQALAEVLTGAVSPSGRLPVCLPRDAGGLPSTYLSPPLGRRSTVSSVDPTPAFAFGHGLSYTTFEWSDAQVLGAPPGQRTDWAVDGEVSVAITIANTGERSGTEVVQLYLHDPVASVTRPIVRLIGFTRVDLDPGERTRVIFTVPADLASFTGLDGRRIVEPGDMELRFGRSSEEFAAVLPLRLVGEVRQVDHRRALVSSSSHGDPPAAAAGSRSESSNSQPAIEARHPGGKVAQP